MADLLLLLGIAQSHTSEISRILIFQVFFGEIMTYFRERDVITMGIPSKIGESPENRDFRPISSRNVHSDNQTQCNDTCFVQNFDLKPLPTPFPHHPPHPHHPTPFPTLLAPTPLPLSTTPSPQQFAPPAKSKSAIKNS